MPNSDMRVAKIIIGITSNALNKLFTYKIPAELIEKIEIGSVVLVPFGKGNNLKIGYIIEIGVLEIIPDYELKYIERIEENVFVEKELIQLAFWMHRRYQCTVMAALKLMLPTDIDVKALTRKTIVVEENQLSLIRDYLESIKSKRQFQKRMEILEFILNVASNSKDREYHFIEQSLLQQFNTSSSLIKSFETLNLLKRRDLSYQRVISVLHKREKVEKFELTPQQKASYLAVMEQKDGHEVFLLHGVTGSGKTEVYMQLIERILLDGKDAIVLIPEIGLTPQMIARFIERFGDVVGVMHSRLNVGERYEQWQKAKLGITKIMIGARSAVFTPFSKLGIIIIDEEHEHTYKSDQNPRYHAREVAIKRGMTSQCPVVLGTATPLIETYYKAMNSQYKLLRLTDKAITDANKEVHITDMRLELEAGNPSVLSRELHKAMQEALSRNEQIILFLNRRGYANFLSCRKCGFVYTCDQCDVSLTYHKSNNRLICHFCGDSKKVEPTCPKCQSKYIKAFGAGTQRIETYIKSVFPDAVIGRMDQDTTSQKHGHEKILTEFREKKMDILIGTQMIAKGHDFHNVTVVGVLAADLSLNIDDYRASERTFQLVTQVIGRTGRGVLKGKAYIQTYQPEHFAIMNAVNEDYESFYEEEILFRQTMTYPPFCQLLEIVCMSVKEYEAKQFLTDNLEKIRRVFEEAADLTEQANETSRGTKGVSQKDYIILGPTKTSIGKIKGYYRYRIIIKGSSYKKLTLVMKELYNIKDSNTKNKDLKLIMDINPMSLS